MTAPTSLRYPGPEAVALAWVATVGLDVDDLGTDLPGDPTLWAPRGFVQIPFSTGGSPLVHLPQREPTVQIDVWANRPRSELPPWRRAEHHAGTLVAAMHAQRRPVELDLGPGWHPVRLHSIWALTEPRRVLGDPSRYARVTFDAATRWVVLDG